MNSFKTAVVALALQSFALMGADYFPLREGNTWTYREAATGQSFTIQVSDPVTIAGNIYYKLTGYTDADLLVRVESVYGALVYWNQERGQDILLTSFEQFEGGFWAAPFRQCAEEEGQGQLKRPDYEGPIGPVAGVLEVRYRAIGCADAGPVQEQYAEHLGMLRRVQNTIAGPLTFDLISARVGNLMIDRAPAARFSLSVGSVVAGSPLSATFRLQVGSPLTLSFSSGQEYDFSLNDSAGRTLWTWSADRTFVQSLTGKTVTGEWAETVEIPASAIPVVPGDYTVQAWVTTTGVRAFAATAPVSIAPPQ